MRKVLIYSLLLVAGLIASQLLDGNGALAIKLATMFCLSFIMIRVGTEFDLDKSRPRQYAWDYVVAMTAAAFPWLFCAAYFVWVMDTASWKEALLLGRFASPTSAGVLFAMLAAAGLAATWLFKKARVLAIFDDLDTILLMIPLQLMMVGWKWPLLVVVAVIAVLLWLGWRYLHRLRFPSSCPWLLLYAAVLTGVCEAVYLVSKGYDASAPVHFEVLLPAFVLGSVLARPHPHAAYAEVEETVAEKWIVTGMSACFMLLVGLSAPVIPREGINWGLIAGHVVLVTVLSNVGKMFPALCYRKEATWRERLALAIGMFPRGEVGAGVLVISLSYGLTGPALTVAVLSLALNLLCTGLFIWSVKKLTRVASQAKVITPPAMKESGAA